MAAPNSSYECGQCRSRYCTMHNTPIFYDQGEDYETDDQPGHEYEHWDEDLEEDEQKIPKGCITCTTHPKFIDKRVFRDDEVTKYLLKHAKLKDYNEAIKFLKMELSVKTHKQKERPLRGQSGCSTLAELQAEKITPEDFTNRVASLLNKKEEEEEELTDGDKRLKNIRDMLKREDNSNPSPYWINIERIHELTEANSARVNGLTIEEQRDLQTIPSKVMAALYLEEQDRIDKAIAKSHANRYLASKRRLTKEELERPELRDLPQVATKRQQLVEALYRPPPRPLTKEDQELEDNI